MFRAMVADTRVLVVDDHPVMRRGLAQTINDQPGMQVCGEAGNVAEALLLMESARPHLAVVDISLGGASGIELITIIREKWPDVKVLVSSMHDETLFAERSLRAGALGYVDKGAAPDAFVMALKRVNAGQVYLSERMTGRMLDHVHNNRADDQRSPIDKLSNRELQVFEMIGKGMVSKQIAAQLGLSPKTVETHREHIKAKLNLTNASALTQHAVQWVLEQGRR